MQRFLPIICFVFVLFRTYGGPLDVSGVEPADLADSVDVSIIVNSQFPAESIPSGDLKKLYLGSKTKIDGKTIVICALQSGDVHKSFLNKYVGKTSSQFRNHWKRLEFTGKGKSPKWFSSETKLLEYVSKKPGAIGYVARSKVSDKVTELKIDND